MVYHILAVGDVVGEQGLEHLERRLRSLKQLKDIHFTVVNGENASGTGITDRQADRIYQAGADVITLGNHTFGWRRTPTSCAPPTTPDGPRAGAGVSTTAGACRSG